MESGPAFTLGEVIFQDFVDKSVYRHLSFPDYQGTYTAKDLPNAADTQEWINESANFRESPHPDILHTIFALPYGDRWLIVTEQVEHNLSFEIKRRMMFEGYSFFSLSEVHAVLRPCLEGLEAIWNAGKCHGNINPSSVFMTTDGRWKLGNFNSKMYMRANPQFYIAYKHPCILRKETVEGWSADLHALGILTLYMCTFEEPEAIADAVDNKPYNRLGNVIHAKYECPVLIKLISGLLKVTRSHPAQQSFGNLRLIMNAFGEFIIQRYPPPIEIDINPQFAVIDAPPESNRAPAEPMIPSDSINGSASMQYDNGGSNSYAQLEESKQYQQSAAPMQLYDPISDVPMQVMPFQCPNCNQYQSPTAIPVEAVLAFVCEHCFALTRIR